MLKDYPKWIKHLAGCLLLITILVLIQSKKNNNVYGPDGHLIKLPNFRSLDIDGNLIKSSNFSGKNLYIQFLKDPGNDDLELIRRIHLNWMNHNLEIVLVVKDYFDLQTQLEFSQENQILILSKDFNHLKSLFRAANIGSYYLFDSVGTLVKEGNSRDEYEKELKRILNKTVSNKFFRISDFIKLNDNIRKISWFRQISEIIKNENKEFYVVSMFISICSGCSSGSIIRMLKDFHSKTKSYAYTLCVLNNHYNEKDITVLKSQLGIEFSIVIADYTLSQKWNSLIQEFSKVELSEILLIIDDSGKIIRILDPNCQDCFKPFFNYLNNLIR